MRKKAKSVLEDKSVKPGNEVYPDNGWAIFMAGGPGAAKSTAIKTQILFDGKVIDNDHLTDLYYDYLKAQLNSNKTSEVDKSNIIKKYGDVRTFSKTSSKYNDEFRQKVIDNKQLMSKAIKMYIENSGKSMQNVIIDSTGLQTAIMIQTALMLKNIGYNIAIVWVVASINESIIRNMKRGQEGGRKVDIDFLVNTHKQLLSILPNQFRNGTFGIFDDAWLIFTDKISFFSDTFNEKYANTAIRLEKRGNTFMIPPKMFRKIIRMVDPDHINNESTEMSADATQE